MKRKEKNNNNNIIFLTQENLGYYQIFIIKIILKIWSYKFLKKKKVSNFEVLHINLLFKTYQKGCA